MNQASIDVLEEFLKSVANNPNSKEIDGDETEKENSKEEECDDSTTGEKTPELQESEGKEFKIGSH